MLYNQSSHMQCRRDQSGRQAEDDPQIQSTAEIATWLLSSSSCKSNRQVASHNNTSTTLPSFFSVSLASPPYHTPVANTRRDPCTSHTSRITHTTMLM